MSIYSPSYAGFTNPYKFSAYRSSAVNSTTSDAVLVFNTENFDTGSNYDNTTGVFTAPIAGFYFFDAAHQVSSGSNAAIAIKLFQNSTAVASDTTGLTSGVNGNQTANVCKLLQLAASDTVSIKVSNSLGTLGINTGNNITWFDGWLVSAT